jgi:hypothetical protein
VPEGKYDSQVGNYLCPLNCTTLRPVSLHVRCSAESTELFAMQLHMMLNHAKDRSLNITHQQRVGIHRAVHADPLQPGVAVINRSASSSASFSPEKVIRVTQNRQRADERLVRQERTEMFKPLVWGIDLDDKKGLML